MSFLFNSVPTQKPTVHHLRFSDSQIGTVIPYLAGVGRLPTHLIWYGDFKATLHKGSSGKGFGGASKGQYYTYSASIMYALCLGTIHRVGRAFSSDGGGMRRVGANLVNQRWSVFNGAAGQAPWSYLGGKHPGQDIGYTGIAYMAQANADLLTSAQLPQENFEVFGQFPFSANNPYANPADVLPDIIGNAMHGMDPGATWIGDLTNFRTYCTAHSFFISAYMDQQKPGREWLSLLLEQLHCEAVWSEGQLRIAPYATAAMTGNGVTWTPNLTPIAAFTDDDYIAKPGEPPVTITSADPMKRNNVMRIEHMDAANDYNITFVETMDESDVLLLGFRRDTPRQYHFIPNSAMAGVIAQFKLQWGLYVSRQYSFKAPPTKAALLDPMDPITISDTLQGIQNLPVRVVSIDETGPAQDSGYELTVTCEDVGPSSQPGYLPTQVSGGTTKQNTGAPPSFVNSPIVIEPNFLYNDPFQIWIGLSGQNQNLDWGGCNIWLSIDGGNSYSKVGTCTNPSATGSTLADFPAHADPDTTDTLQLDLSESAGVLDAISTAEADQGVNLAWLDNELISFATVAAGASANQFNVTYVRRGLFGTTIKDHPTGSAFVYLGSVTYPDQGVAQINYPKNQVGKTVYLKFTSFNTQQDNEQDLSKVDALQYAIVGPIVRQIPPANAWSANATFASGSFINANSYTFEAVVSGTSGSTAPTWPADYNATVVDHTVTWQNIGPSIAITQNQIGGAEFTGNGLLLDWFGATLNPGGWLDVINTETGAYNRQSQFIQSQETMSGPLEMSFDWWSSGQLDFLVPSGADGSNGSNGYLFRLDPTKGSPMADIYRLDNGAATYIGTTTLANPTALAAAWHKAVIIIYGDTAGTMEMYVDGVLHNRATDAKYPPNGAIGYAYGEGSSPTRFRNALIFPKAQTLDQLPDGQNRGIPIIGHFHVAQAYTYTVPSWATHLVIYVFGAGGGGNGSVGGAAGDSLVAYVDVTPGATAQVVVGAGGTTGAGSTSTSGTSGGNSSVTSGGVSYTANGGLGAIGSTPGTSGQTALLAEYSLYSPGLPGQATFYGRGPGGHGGSGSVAAHDGKVVIIPSA